MCTCDLQLIPNQRDKQSLTSKYSEQKYKISEAPQKNIAKTNTICMFHFNLHNCCEMRQHTFVKE